MLCVRHKSSEQPRTRRVTKVERGEGTDRVRESSRGRFVTGIPCFLRVEVALLEINITSKLHFVEVRVFCINHIFTHNTIYVNI